MEILTGKLNGSLLKVNYKASSGR